MQKLYNKIFEKITKNIAQTFKLFLVHNRQKKVNVKKEQEKNPAV